VAFEDYFTLLVDKHDVGNPNYLVTHECPSGLGLVVLEAYVPLLSVYVVDELLGLLVGAYADDSHALLIPLLPISVKHLLVVTHGALAGGTPGGPEVYQPHFSLVVFE